MPRPRLFMHAVQHTTLCYGENRRIKEAELHVRPEATEDLMSLRNFELVLGQAPSFVNMTDYDRVLKTAVQIGAGFEHNFESIPHIAIAVKHGNACGASVSWDTGTCLNQMVMGDPDAISGGVVLTNFHLEEQHAEILLRHGMPEGSKRVLDSVLAPGFGMEAQELLARKATDKCRLLRNPYMLDQGLGVDAVDKTERIRQVRGGYLRQDGDSFVLPLMARGGWGITHQQCLDVVFAWGIGSTQNSNTITIVKDGQLLGQGVNQRSRVMAVKVAELYTRKYGHDTTDAVAYSDSFFPFPDGVEALADMGVRTVFTTSGSKNDNLVIAAAERRGVKLLMLPDAEARGFSAH